MDYDNWHTLTLPFSLLKEKLKDTTTYDSVYGTPNPMATHKKNRAIKNRKKNRGVKHGRRKK